VQKVKAFQNMVQLKERLRNYWHSLSEDTFCRDLTPGKPLFRSNLNLFLTYNLVHILIGRSFILDELNINTKDTPSAEWTKLRSELVNDCINSAVTTVHLCQTLHDESSLSKSSYTEFSSCCAAVLALVAKCVSDKSQFHDHQPAKQMGIKSSWIERPGASMGNTKDPVYNWKFATLGDMADALEKELAGQ